MSKKRNSTEDMFAELRETREIAKADLESSDRPEPKGFTNEIRASMSKYNVLDLAVPFIMGR